MRRVFYVLESKGNKKAWEIEQAYKTSNLAIQAKGRRERFSRRWAENKAYRIVAVAEV